MNKNEKEFLSNIKRMTKSLERIAKALENNQKSGLVDRGPRLVRNPKIKHV